jgi:hypothetical protein
MHGLISPRKWPSSFKMVLLIVIYLLELLLHILQKKLKPIYIPRYTNINNTILKELDISKIIAIERKVNNNE